MNASKSYIIVAKAQSREIVQWRKRNKLTQTALAKAMDVCRRTIFNIESGRPICISIYNKFLALKARYEDAHVNASVRPARRPSRSQSAVFSQASNHGGDQSSIDLPSC